MSEILPVIMGLAGFYKINGVVRQMVICTRCGNSWGYCAGDGYLVDSPESSKCSVAHHGRFAGSSDSPEQAMGSISMIEWLERYA